MDIWGNKEFIIEKIAESRGWQKTDATNNGIMMTFIRGKMKVEIWPSRMTVATMLRHPKKGKSKLYRCQVTFELLDEIFKNPRVHTGKGYYEKS